MKISQLFSLYPQFKLGLNALRDINALTFNSKEVQANDVFIAVRGEKADGHDFLNEVCLKDVAGVVVESENKIPKDFNGSVLVVPDSRQALGPLAARFYGNPAASLYCVGITGTNGKTSTSYFVEHILNQFGQKTGVIGTINHHIDDKVWPSDLTTPDAITLQKRLREFVAFGGKALAMEVSSHALEQKRVVGIPFDCVVFTNFSREHLDYHLTLESYFAAKERLFSEVPAEFVDKKVIAVLNANDSAVAKTQLAANVHAVTFGENKSDYQFQILEMNYSKTRIRLVTSRGSVEIEIPLPGRHNVYNAVSALAVGVAAGASIETVTRALTTFSGVPGRLERVENAHDRHVFVDYAHKPEALREVLNLLVHVRKTGHLKSKIITVFGCGGDRDKGKRPIMGQIACELSDQVLITSDNPRSEGPQEIIDQILAGIEPAELSSKVKVEADRRKAIQLAIDLSSPGDVVLIAGKGHEDYQILNSKKVDFSDVDVARSSLDAL